MKEFPNLLSPIKIGSYTYKNRIEAAPTIFATLALIPQISDRVLRMIEDRAKGGCASVINGEIPVNFDDSLRPIIAGEGKVIQVTVEYKNFDDPAFALFQKNAAVITRHDAIAIAELSHFGVEKPLLDDGILPLGPVAYTKEDGTPVRAFDKESMEKVANDFADAADFMKAAGFQGVFVHCGHGWMIGQFLSNRNNKRTDEYGGSIENRARVPMAILQTIRERCGADFLIEIRLSGEENLPEGITIDETVAFCKLLEGTGLVDLIHVSAGHYYSPARSHEFSTIFTPHGLNADYAAAVKKAVSIPVAVVGGITTPEMAERIIAEGKADIVSMGRQMIADPAFAKKAAEGCADEIRACIRCCVCYPGPSGEHKTDPVGRHLPGLGSCTINPYNVNSFSHHTILPEDMPKPKASRKVLIVGGGPGGMQAAIDAADRGHNVILADNADQLGGILRLTDNDFYKKDLGEFKDLLVREVGKRGIDVRLNTHVTPEIIKETKPDALIIAIGAEPAVPPIPGIEKAVTALDVYCKPEGTIGNKVVVVGGGLVGCEVGLELVQRGRDVIVIEMLERLVENFIGIYRTALLDHMDEVGIRSLVKTKCKEIKADGVLVADESGKEDFIPADAVVIAVGMKAKTEEAKKLREAAGDIPVFEIGDCVRAAKVGEAIQEGYTAALSIV
jgi:2,4-dienoyl-CoA reductase-like NADH-dependent reductase (Old Yellow Enzyme family)/thioredoxin reductase